jgi:hypothetical protein
VNSNGVYPLEFTARFGYPTISIQQEGLLTPLGELFIKLAEGSTTRFRARSGFQIGVRIVVPPFPLNDEETFASSSKDAVILFKTQSRDGVHIEDVKTVNGVARHRIVGRGADRVRHRNVDATGAAAGLQPRPQHHDPQHVLPRGRWGPGRSSWPATGADLADAASGLHDLPADFALYAAFPATPLRSALLRSRHATASALLRHGK